VDEERIWDASNDHALGLRWLGASDTSEPAGLSTIWAGLAATLKTPSGAMPSAYSLMDLLNSFTIGILAIIHATQS